MKARNVIISLVFVLALLVFIIIKIRNEPKKKLVLNRNPSRISTQNLHYAGWIAIISMPIV